MSDNTVRLATWNLYLGADIVPIVDVDAPDRVAKVGRFLAEIQATRFFDRAVAIAEVLARSRPDVIGLQELVRYTRITPSEVTVFADHLVELLAALEAQGSPYVVVESAETYSAEYPWAERRRLGFQNFDAVLVSQASLSAGRVVVTRSGTGTFGCSFWRTSEALDRSGWVYADLSVAGASLRFHTTHLDAGLPDVRLGQAEELAAAAGSSPYPAVVVGDLNVEAGDGVLEALVSTGLVDAWSASTLAPSTNAATWGHGDDLRSLDPLEHRLDYVLLDSSLSWRDVGLLGADSDDRTASRPRLWPSDHAGVIVDYAPGS